MLCATHLLISGFFSLALRCLFLGVGEKNGANFETQENIGDNSIIFVHVVCKNHINFGDNGEKFE